MGFCFLVKIDPENIATSKFIPHMNLLVVVTDKSFGIRVVKTPFDWVVIVLADFSSTKVHVEFKVFLVLTNVLRVSQLSFLFENEMFHSLYFLARDDLHNI